MRIYMSGGILHVENAARTFADAKKRLSLGSPEDEFVNPFDIPACPDGSCANSGRAMLPSGHTWECFMKYNIQELLKCDAIVMLYGWEKSRGAAFELYVATQVGLFVIGFA